VATTAVAQDRPSAAPSAYAVFLGGLPIGREDITVTTDATGTTVTSEGRMSAPTSIVIRKAEFRYRSDWSPESFVLDSDVAGADIVLSTSFRDGTAVTEGTQSGRPLKASHAVAPGAVVISNAVFGSYAGLTRKLATASAGDRLRAYVVPQSEIGLRVDAVRAERMQIGASFLNVRRYDLVLGSPGGNVAVHVTAGEDGSLLRLSIPAQSLEVLRADLAASTSRTEVYSNPGDEAVTIPAAGFNLGATLTRPASAPAAGRPGRAPAPVRLPAVVLVSGSGVGDRDGFALGIPTLAHLAGALSESGFVAVRYDKRGNGQSGGRAESATLSDFADDVRTVVRWLADRRDIDAKRIAVVGHSEGAWIAMLAATREKRIAGVASIAGPSTSGADLILEQQRQALDRLDLTSDEREKRVALQKQIHAAVATGKGWEGVPAELRRQADTPWFQSLVAFDPARVVADVKSPLLLVHGELDRQVPVAHVDRLASLARKGDSSSVEVVVVRGVNHLLVPAETGEVSEYGALRDREVSKDVAGAVTGWLRRTMQAIK
jgi:hypothetical protein